jgi:hypothetical protein
MVRVLPYLIFLTVASIIYFSQLILVVVSTPMEPGQVKQLLVIVSGRHIIDSCAASLYYLVMLSLSYVPSKFEDWQNSGIIF